MSSLMFNCIKVLISVIFKKCVTDGRTDRQTDRRMDQRTDGWTKPLIEMRGCI